VIGRLHHACPDIKVHLVGHSFGARLVSYALTGLPQPPLNGKSPVKSLFLLQGAFSHYAFAQQLPHDRNRSGDLAGMASRVDGPLIATHSEKDLALVNSYPIGSILARQDAAATQDFVSERWGAIGYDGAKAVAAQNVQLGGPGSTYNFQVAQWLNLDGNTVIVNGDPPSGAHSDIIHPHTAWAALAGAGILGN
jgi:pimeloyl-ACP methyl ester carboxylesterase